MAGAVYPLTLEKMWKGDIDADAGTVKIVAVSSTYVYSAAHEFFDDVTGQLGNAATLTSKTFTAGVFDAADLTVSGVTSGNTITAFIIYIDTGSAATSPLLVFEDRRADTTPVNFAGNNLDINVSWPLGYIATI